MTRPTLPLLAATLLAAMLLSGCVAIVVGVLDASRDEDGVGVAVVAFFDAVEGAIDG